MAKTTARRGTRGRKGRELVARSGTVTGWEAGLYLHADGRREDRERKAMLALDVYGNLQEPVRNVSAFKITLFSEPDPTPGQAEIPSVDSIIAVKPTLDLVVTLADRELNLLAAMAAAGRLKHVDMRVQEPKYRLIMVYQWLLQSTSSLQVPDEVRVDKQHAVGLDSSHLRKKRAAGGRRRLATRQQQRLQVGLP